MRFVRKTRRCLLCHSILLLLDFVKRNSMRKSSSKFSKQGWVRRREEKVKAREVDAEEKNRRRRKRREEQSKKTI